MDLFNLAAKLFLDSKGFEDGVKDAEKSGRNLAQKLENSFNKISKVAKAAFTAFTASKLSQAIWGMANGVAAMGDTVDKAAQKMSISRKAYQEWEYILNQNGASIDDMAMSLKTLNNLVTENSADTAAAFAKLGLSSAHLSSLTPEEQFEEVVKAFQKMPQGSQKAALAMKIFGRSGQNLMPLLNQTAESTEELRQRAIELGLIMSDEDVDASVAFGDALDDLRRTFNAFKNTIGAKLLPTFTSAFKKITSYGAGLRKAFDNNGFKGVFDKLVNDVKNIHWPTWSDVINAAKTAWNTIVKGVTEDLPALVFGRKEDGKVNWPTWNDVKTAAEDAWNAIKAEALLLAGLVFGKKDDGTVNWPNISKMKAAAAGVWGKIVEWVGDLGGLIFGRDQEGDVKWPTLTSIKIAAAGLWGKIVEWVAKLGGLVFGRDSNGDVNWPTLDTLKTFASGLWSKVVEFISSFGGLIFGRDNNGDVNWPNLTTLKLAAAGLWGKIVEWVGSLGGLIFGRDEEGEVKWPKLSQLKVIGANIWGKIVEWAAKLGGLVFGRDENGDVKWPDWGTLEVLAERAWDGFKDIIGALGGLIFGRDTDGNVKWPSWSDLEDVAKGLWNDFKDVVGAFAGLIFGRDSDGKVKWPDMKDIKIAAAGVWGKIVEWVGNLGGLIFGRDTNGEVKWPKFADLVKVGAELWGKIVQWAGELGGLIFGRDTKGDVNWPSVHELYVFARDYIWTPLLTKLAELTGLRLGNSERASEIFKTLADSIVAIGAAFITYKLVSNMEKLVGLFSGGGLTGWKKWELILAGIAAVSLLIYEHWDEIEQFAAEAGVWIDENIIQPIEDFWEEVKTWFNDNIFEPFLQPILEFFQTIFDQINDILVELGLKKRSNPVKPAELTTLYGNKQAIDEKTDEYLEKKGIGGKKTAEELAKAEEDGVDALLDLRETLREYGVEVREENGQRIVYQGGKKRENITEESKHHSTQTEAELEQDILLDYLRQSEPEVGVDPVVMRGTELKEDKKGIPVWDKVNAAQTTEEKFDVLIDTYTEGVSAEFEKVDNTLTETAAKTVLTFVEGGMDFESLVDAAGVAFVGAAKAAGRAFLAFFGGTGGVGGQSDSGGNGAKGQPYRVVDPANAKEEKFVRPHAKGLWEVPYDDYVARLHRGERVLTASQARRMNEGVDTQSMYRIVAEAVSAAVEHIQINMDGKAVGRAVAPTVSQSIYQEALGRRYAK